MGALIVKMVTEVALGAWAGRMVLGLWLGAAAAQNLFWRLLDTVIAPVERRVGGLCPAAWTPTARRACTVGVLLLVWLVATVLKIRLCLSLGPGACR